jgi:hypothetical protein
LELRVHKKSWCYLSTGFLEFCNGQRYNFTSIDISLEWL